MKIRTITLFIGLTVWVCSPGAVWALDPPVKEDAGTLDEIKGEVGTVPRGIDIPEGIRGSISGPSTGAAADPVVPATFSQGIDIGSDINAGIGYACGDFDPFDNVEEMLNSAVEKFKKLPQYFVLGVEAAIAAAPAYLMNKINPTLYNVVTKNLDEAFELFEAEYKSCAQLEREVQLGQNPYGQLFKASVFRNQSIIIGEDGIVIDEAMTKVRQEGAIEGVVMAGGETYGGEDQEPVDINSNVILAGSNIILGRPATSEDAFGDEDQINPLVRHFTDPADIIDFVKVVYGSTEFDLMPEGVTVSTPGIGYQHEYIRVRNLQIAHLRQFVKDEITREKYQELSNYQIAPEYLKEIRRLDLTAKDIAIDDFARELAIKIMLEKLDFVASVITAGLREPNIARSEAYQVIEPEVAKLMLAVQRDIAHLNNARYQ